MFGGENEPRPSFSDFLAIMFDPPAGDARLGDRSQRSNNVFALDMDLRIPDVRRWGLPMRDLRLYGEFGWDDTCCETATIPLREAVSLLAGIHAIGLFGQQGLDARFEYANSSSKSFTHFQFTEGYSSRGSVLSHFIGTAGENYYSRVTNHLTPNLMLGLELDRGVIGSTTHNFRGPKERCSGSSSRAPSDDAPLSGPARRHPRRHRRRGRPRRPLRRPRPGRGGPGRLGA
jgi:hypothetical protein